MLQRPHKVLFSFLCVALLASSAFGLAFSEDFQQTYDLSANGRVSIENVNGSVEIEGWDRAEVQVEYVKKARTQEGLDRMDVQIDATASGISIVTEYKKTSGARYNNDGGSVDFKLYVPRQARVDDVELVNGNLELRQLTGDISVEVVNGDINATGLGGRVEISSVNGSMDIAFDQLTSGQRVDLESVNGSMSVALPSNGDADISAETVHGKIENDFGFEVEKDRYVGRSMNGSLGSGGARVDLENVNGSITVRSL